MPLVPGKAERDVKSFKISSSGAVLQGGMAPEIRDIAREYEKVTGQSLARIQIDDRRAQQLLVSCVGNEYYVVPAPELFSRHTGTCRVLGDKHQRTTDYQLQVGDFLRIGSVGLIVSELHPGDEHGRGGGGGEAGHPHAMDLANGGGFPRERSSTSTSVGEAITERDLFYLREDVGELRDDLFAQEEAATAAEEGEAAIARGLSPGRSPRQAQCYMCFDDEDTLENPLVAPCLCKGGTRYVHLTCLQRWHTSAGDDKDCVVTSAEAKNTCKVCKSKYKTHVRSKDGRLLPLMVHQLPPPFICFLVVTKHETAEELFNTQFQLSFSENKQIVIGRSRNCNMVLDYRTVSTQHATVTFRKGGFFFRDLSSSNGSMLNLRRPMKLPYNQWVRIRYGRSIVAFKAKRSWMRRKLSSMGSTMAGTTGMGGGGGNASSASNNSAAMSIGSGAAGSPRQRESSGMGSVASHSSDMAAAVLSGVDPETLRQAHLQLLESLCRIDLTPGLRAGGTDMGGFSLSPGGRYNSLAHAGESMSPSALGAALFQMHLQAASSRGVLALPVEDEEQDGSGGAAAGGGGGGQGTEEGRRKSTGRSAAQGGPFPGVRFVPADSPMAESQVSQLSR